MRNSRFLLVSIFFTFLAFALLTRVIFQNQPNVELQQTKVVNPTDSASHDSSEVFEYLLAWPPLPEGAYRVSGTVMIHKHLRGPKDWPQSILIFDYSPVLGAMGLALQPDRVVPCPNSNPRKVKVWQYIQAAILQRKLDVELRCGGPVITDGMEIVIAADSSLVPKELNDEDLSPHTHPIEAVAITIIAITLTDQSSLLEHLLTYWESLQYEELPVTLFVGHLLWGQGEVEDLVSHDEWQVYDPDPLLVRKQLQWTR